MANSSISADMLHLNLKQLGATKINSSLSRVITVKFEINSELTVSYFCHVKDEEKIFLQRIEPYPVRNYKFETVENIIQFIQKDVEQFVNASRSSNFKKFLEIIHENYEVRKELEELFLLSNVSSDKLDDILNEEFEVLTEIKNTERITLKNDPGRYPGEEADLMEDISGPSIESEIYEDVFTEELYEDLDLENPTVMLSAIKSIVKGVIHESLDEIKDTLKKEILAEMKK